MARLRLGISLLAAVFIIAAAAQHPAFLSDNIVPSSNQSPKVKTASYGYDDNEVSCMSQLNYKNCRYTGCPVERTYMANDPTDVDGATGACNTNEQCRTCWPDSIFFQTDFTCCAKEHSYSYEQRRNMNIGDVGFTDKISSCDWEISLHRTWVNTGLTQTLGVTGAQTDPWTPLMTDDGNALKFGTVWGTCYLNAEADQCDSPLCERMAINIQGGLYGACAYSTEQTSGFSQREGMCDNDANIPDWLNAIDVEATPFLNLPTSRFETYLSYFRAYTCAVMATKCGFTNACNTIGLGTVQRAEDPSETQAKIAYDKDYSREEEKFYPGIAIIISGPMHITGQKNKGYEETGMFEMTLDFQSSVASTATISDPTNRWPMVRGKGAKLRFTREEKQEEYKPQEQYKPREEPHYEPRHEERPHYERRQ